MNTATTTRTRTLVALDIDGTLVDDGNKIPVGTVAALDLARAAGHAVVLATGRSLVGLVPLAIRLGLTDGWAVCSNGALTIRLDRSAPSGYDVVAARMFDPAPVIRRALEIVPVVRIAVEEIGWGWRTNAPFEPGELNGQQKLVPVNDLVAQPATRIVIVAPEVRRFTDALHAIGVTVTPMGPDWLDIAARDVNKAVALDSVRKYLNIPADRTVAVGDGVNGLGMLAWAERSVAMGHAPAIVRSVADETTGAISQAGALSVLASLVPDVDGSSSSLAAQIATAQASAPGPIVLRVWHGIGSDLTRCEAWTLETGQWARHAPIQGRRRAQWRSVTGHGPAGFELPLSGP